MYTYSHQALGNPKRPCLPSKLWREVFSHLEDHRDLIHVACTSRSFSNLVEDFLKHHTLVLDSLETVVNFDGSDYLKSQRAAALVRKLIVRVEEEVNDCFIVNLSKALHRLSSIHTVQLYLPGVVLDFEHTVDLAHPPHVSSQEFAPTRVRSQLVSRLIQAPLPLLRSFTSATPTTRAILFFIQNHSTIEDLALADVHESLRYPNARVQISLPSSCGTLTCTLDVLSYLATPPGVTHLFFTEHAPFTFESIPNALAQQLVSIRFGALVPGYHNAADRDGSITVDIMDILVQFPRLRYFEQHMPQVQPFPFLYISSPHHDR